MPDNPFNAFLDPSKQGTISGMIGGLMGNPTQSEAAGGATGQALQQLSALKDQGLNNQQALLKFFQTPQGHDYFTSAGPDGLKQLVDGLQATSAPSAVMNNIAPGGMLTATDPSTGKVINSTSNPQQFPNQVLGPQDIQVNGQGQKLAENPNQKSGDIPADVKSFTFFADLAKLPIAERQRLAALKADPTKGGPDSVSGSAWDKLGTDFGLDPRTVQAGKAGALKVLPLKDQYGQDTGAVSIVDLSNPSGATVQLLNPANKGASPSITPAAGTNPSTGAATGVLPAAEPVVGTDGTVSAPGPAKAGDIAKRNPNYFGTKSSMFLASGPIATGLQGASAASEMINPKMIIPEGAQAADRQTQIDTLRSDLAAMGQIGGSMGVNKGVLEGYLKLAPSGGLTESPHQAIQKAIRLSDHIQQEIEAQSKVLSDPHVNIEQKKGAQALIQGWQRVQRDLPTVDELSKMEEAIRNGTAGAPTISGAAKTIVNAGSKALTEVKKEAGTVAKDNGIGESVPNIDSISDPKQLLAIDPSKLDRAGKIKLLRKLDSLRKSNGATQP